MESNGYDALKTRLLHVCRKLKSDSLDCGGKQLYLVKNIVHNVEFMTTDVVKWTPYHLFLSKDNDIIERFSFVNSLQVQYTQFVINSNIVTHEIKLVPSFKTSLVANSIFKTLFVILPHEQLLLDTIKHQLTQSLFDLNSYCYFKYFHYKIKHAFIHVNTFETLIEKQPIVLIIEYKQTFVHHTSHEACELKYIPYSKLNDAIGYTRSLYAIIAQDAYNTVAVKRHHRFL
jgi:hypothetical protein